MVSVLRKICCLSRVVSSDDSCLVCMVQGKYPLAENVTSVFLLFVERSPKQLVDLMGDLVGEILSSAQLVTIKLLIPSNIMQYQLFPLLFHQVFSFPLFPSPRVTIFSPQPIYPLSSILRFQSSTNTHPSTTCTLLPNFALIPPRLLSPHHFPSPFVFLVSS